MLTAPRLEQRLIERLRAGTQRLLVDLEGVTFFDSTMLSVLLSVTRQSAAKQAGLAVICRQDRFWEIFRATGLLGQLNVVQSPEEGLSTLASANG